ncbi:MAG: type II secretion system F family protein [Thermodesulfobacteriota bacterium]|nr:type II secretion system F family protein [Thermodesulfobacteriota bacterium]
MEVYVWEGRSRKGTIERGEIEAANEAAVRSHLRRQQIQAIKIQAKPKDILKGITLFKRKKVNEKEIVIFTRQFATMIDAGLPLVQCLEILSSQQDNPFFKETLIRVKGDVEAGSTFADALRKHPRVFNDLFCNLVAAGEAGGILDTILNRLAAYIEKAMNLKKKVKGAMVYPAAVMAIALIVVASLLIFVIPVFQKMFADMGGTLPAFTQLVINLSEFMQRYFLLVLALLVALFFFFKRYYRTESGRETVDSSLLKIPVIGELIKKVAIAKFTRTLSTMLSSGVPILEGLEIVARTSGNKVIEKAILKTKVSISEGKTIAEPLGASGIFPPMVVQMISVGESTGALDSMLSKIADFFDDEVDAAVAGLTALLEPLLMVFLGGAIGALVIAMYLPIFQMASIVGG